MDEPQDTIIPYTSIYRALSEHLEISGCWRWYPPPKEGNSGWGRRVMYIEVKFAGRTVAECEIEDDRGGVR